MNNKEFEDLFYKVPEGVDYADILEDVDLEDVPEETIQKLTSLLDSDDDYLRYQASRLLTIWGIREGFDVLTQMFSQGQLEGMISHRLYGYDDTNRIFLYDIVNYWASRYDLGEEKMARGEFVKSSNRLRLDIMIFQQYIAWLVRNIIRNTSPT